jgi:hypothetical protein
MAEIGDALAMRITMHLVRGTGRELRLRTGGAREFPCARMDQPASAAAYSPKGRSAACRISVTIAQPVA